jgi:hypothetical protein
MSIALALISTGRVKLFGICDLEPHMSDYLRIVDAPEAWVP